MTSYGTYLAETLLTLLAVSAMAFAVLYGARRMGIGRPSGPISLRGHLPLDPRRAVYLVKVASKVIVVGVAEGGMTKLGELDEADLPAPKEPTSGFAAVLAKMLNAPKKPSDGGDVS